MNSQNNDDMATKLASLSVVEFLALGTDGLAYIKPTDIIDDVQTYSMNAADGTHIASGQDTAVLRAIAQQQNLTAVTVQ